MKLKIELLPYQMQTYKAKEPYVGFIAGTGTGKTFLLPRYLFLMMNKYPDEEWIVSAPTIPMLKRNPVKYIVDDFYIKFGIPHTYNKSEMKLVASNGIVHFIAAETYQRMQGIHAKGIIGDEAGLYPQGWWDTAIQRVAFNDGFILLATTPYSINWLKTSFYDLWKNGDKDYLVINPTSYDNPFYKKELIDRARKNMPSWKFNLFYLAQFPEAGEDQIFSQKAISYAINEITPEQYKYDSVEHEDKNVFTVDVARYGTDNAVIKRWIGYEEVEKVLIPYTSLNNLTGTIIRMADDVRKLEGLTRFDIKIIIDTTGMGAGVGEDIEQAGFNTVMVEFSENAQDTETYGNIRAEMYFKCAKALEEEYVKLLPSESLEKELLAQRFKFDKKGRFLVIAKEKIKESLGHSPDEADATALRFAEKEKQDIQMDEVEW